MADKNPENIRNLKVLSANSLVGFVTAFLFTTFIHESGHFFAYLFSGAHPVLYHNYVSVDEPELSTTIRVIAAMAGPVISLMQGIILGLIVTRRRSSSAWDLLLLWLCLLGLVNFFGYLMLTPLSTGGDTGKAAELIGLPAIYRIFISIAGIAVLILLVTRLGKYFSRFIPVNGDISQRRSYVNALVMYPVLVGSVINVLLAFPVPALLSVIYPATSSYVILSAYGVILRAADSPAASSIPELKISRLLVILMLAGIIINRLLTLGVG
jgi:hypothetical protein